MGGLILTENFRIRPSFKLLDPPFKLSSRIPKNQETEPRNSSGLYIFFSFSAMRFITTWNDEKIIGSLSPIKGRVGSCVLLCGCLRSAFYLKIELF